MIAISIPYIFSYRTLYKSEDQGFKILDILNEASQNAMSKRRTFRVELDLTDNSVLLIDERGAESDLMVKNIPLAASDDLRIGSPPIGLSQPGSPPVNDATFQADGIGHISGIQSVIGHLVWAARFRSDGTVVDASNVPLSANIYLWPPQEQDSDAARSLTEVRVLTLYGSTGLVKFWKYNGTEFLEY